MKYLIYIFCLCTLVACNNAANNTAHLPSIRIDTFYLCDQLIPIDSATKEEFNSVAAVPIPDTSETKNLQKDSLLASRIDDTLYLVTEDSSTIRLVNNYNEAQTTLFKYQYFQGDIDKYIVQVLYYEGYSFLLVDRKTGLKTEVCGLPVLSPDKKGFICGNCDVEAQYTFNGFELYSNAHQPKLTCRRELMVWGPIEIRWSKDGVLMIKASHLDSMNLNNTPVTYHKWRMK